MNARPRQLPAKHGPPSDCGGYAATLALILPLCCLGQEAPPTRAPGSPPAANVPVVAASVVITGIGLVAAAAWVAVMQSRFRARTRRLDDSMKGSAEQSHRLSAEIEKRKLVALELAQKNMDLAQEVAERQRAEVALQEARSGLEDAVRRRTASRDRAHRDLQRQFDERIRMENEILDISVREQRRIGQDLHDGLCQQLTAIAYLCRGLEQRVEREAPDFAGDIRAIGGHLKEAIQQSRDIARGLFPVRIESHGLASALQELAASTSEYFKVTCAFFSEGDPNIEGTARAVHLYYIAREAVTNAIKHARARNIHILLAAQPGEIKLRVTNDGDPFSEPTDTQGGMGLRTMRYRAELLGGTWCISAGPGSGQTTVSCILRDDGSRPA